MNTIVDVPGATDRWRVGDVEFVRSFAHASTPTSFCIRKGPTLMALYDELCPEVRGGSIVELGIADGGSTALISLLTHPRKLVACELDPGPRPALEAFLEQNGFVDTVRPVFGFDQADRPRLTDLVREEFGDGELDLVIDDASHVYDHTVASFEVLFPRLRAGGRYIIEDWAADYVLAERVQLALDDPSDPGHQAASDRVDELYGRDSSARPQPLARLALELMLASVGTPDAIDEVRIDRHWVLVRRGPAALDPGTFRVGSLYNDHFGWLQ